MRADLVASLKWVAPVSLAGAAIVACFAPAILRFLLGASFATAAGALQILSLTVVFSFVSGHGRYALLARGQQRLDLLFVGIGSGAHLFFKLILIPVWGINGAALGTCLGEFVILVLALWAALGRLPNQPPPADKPSTGEMSPLRPTTETDLEAGR